ncbi:MULTISPECIES: SMI1/KNR4 family protein [Pseudanabaena]|uniref:Cell wall assembly/cell proliferation coordinating protein, KNR4 n=2 Tax=Pseudanabaena TaxID=1152 RepID=L8MTR6_9CYAN|nr:MULTISPECIES: SMI1/KNR4 family protein [Pseudanabaena]ELS31342.1 Cell wall assembly/cell proliferation coordinating protein, KNR4 [Pseudanabaena biceps PCC 7429]MDG3496404.1 SMI1/KNR4 family protein [Pseudanabaena catenata USMAC16]
MTNNIYFYLDKISTLFDQYAQDKLDLLQFGVKESAFDLILRNRSVLLPDEVKDLYRWSNGTYNTNNRLFPGISFMSLQEALFQYSSKLRNAEESAIHAGRQADRTWWKRYWFPIFFRDEGDYFILINNKSNKSPSPVFLYNYSDWNDIRPKYMYTSLTSMIRTIVECYETGAYYIVEQNGEMFHECDPEKEETIRLKHNPEALGSYFDLFPNEEFILPG